jgi:hypothetical protein
MTFPPKQIYFLRPVGFEGPIKIGCSAWPGDRLLSLAKWSPFPIELMTQGIGDHTLERALHRLFAADRSHKEWFRTSAPLMSGIEAVRCGAAVDAAFGLTLKPTGRTWPKARYVLEAQRSAA